MLVPYFVLTTYTVYSINLVDECASWCSCVATIFFSLHFFSNRILFPLDFLITQRKLFYKNKKPELGLWKTCIEFRRQSVLIFKLCAVVLFFWNNFFCVYWMSLDIFFLKLHFMVHSMRVNIDMCWVWLNSDEKFINLSLEIVVNYFSLFCSFARDKITIENRRLK